MEFAGVRCTDRILNFYKPIESEMVMKETQEMDFIVYIFDAC